MTDIPIEPGNAEEREAQKADRATPSVAKAGALAGQQSIWMWIAGGVGTAAAVWFMVIVPMRGEEPARTAVDPKPAVVDRSTRAVDTQYPGDGFEMGRQASAAPATEPPRETTDPQVASLELQIKRLELQLAAEKEKSAQQVRMMAFQQQLEAAKNEEADRVKRLRSDILIRDFSGDNAAGSGPRDLPNDPLAEGEGQIARNARPDAPNGSAGPAGATDSGGPSRENPFPPALLDQLREQGVDLTPGGQP